MFRQFGDFALPQRGSFLLDSRNASFSHAYLPNDPDQFGTDPLALHGVRAVLILIEYPLEGFSASPRLISARLASAIQSSAAIKISGQSLAKVGMDALGNFTEQALEFGRWREVRTDYSPWASSYVWCACLPGLFLLCLVEAGGRIKLGQQLGDSRLPFIQFRVERTNLSMIATLNSGKLATTIDKFQFKLREGRADGRKFLALPKNFLLFWF